MKAASSSRSGQRVATTPRAPAEKKARARLSGPSPGRSAPSCRVARGEHDEAALEIQLGDLVRLQPAVFGRVAGARNTAERSRKCRICTGVRRHVQNAPPPERRGLHESLRGSWALRHVMRIQIEDAGYGVRLGLAPGSVPRLRTPSGLPRGTSGSASTSTPLPERASGDSRVAHPQCRGRHLADLEALPHHQSRGQRQYFEGQSIEGSIRDDDEPRDRRRKARQRIAEQRLAQPSGRGRPHLRAGAPDRATAR